MTNGTNDPPATRPTSDNRSVINATCALHRGPRTFTNLVVEKRGGEIVLDPHATGSCVIILDEAAATALFDVLGRWIG